MPNEDPYPNQTREVIYNLYKYYNERKSILLCEHCDDVDVPKMVSEITGVPDADIKFIVDEEIKRQNQAGYVPGLRRRRRRRGSSVRINTFTKVVIRREVAYYFQRHRKFPTVMKLIKILEDKGVLLWKYTYMRRILESLGFRVKRRSRSRCEVVGFK